MSHVFNKLINALEDARKSATLENAGFGFPHERIEIKKVHFSSEGGEVGDEVHPTDYIRRMVDLHHRTWIIGPLDEAISILKSHRDLIDRAEKLRHALNIAGLDELINAARGNRTA